MTTKQLPEKPNLDHLRDQAKSLLKGYRNSEPDALERFIQFLPSAKGKSPEQLAAMDLRLHDAQSVIAREYGLLTWNHLLEAVENARTRSFSPTELRELYKYFVFGKGFNSPKPTRAKALLDNHPSLRQDPYLALTTGIVSDELLEPSRVNEPVEGMPPLLWVCHSSLIQLEGDEAVAIRTAAKKLIAAGADLEMGRIDDQFPDSPLAALYGAAGQNHDVELTRILLEAGANPNDNESMYHSVESRNKEILQMLVAHGGRWKGTNAMLRHLDFEDVEGLKEAISLGAEPNGYPGEVPPIFHALTRGRSADHVKVLLEAGADATATFHGTTAFVLATLVGNVSAAKYLADAGASTQLSTQEDFIGACAAGELDRAENLLAKNPSLFKELLPQHLAMLPLNAAHGNLEGCRTMLAVGWPVNSRGLEWNSSALDQSIFSGNVELVRLLIENGIDIYQTHGYNSNSWGTLSFVTDKYEELPENYQKIADLMLKIGPPLPDLNVSMALKYYLSI